VSSLTVNASTSRRYVSVDPKGPPWIGDVTLSSLAKPPLTGGLTVPSGLPRSTESGPIAAPQLTGGKE